MDVSQKARTSQGVFKSVVVSPESIFFLVFSSTQWEFWFEELFPTCSKLLLQQEHLGSCLRWKSCPHCRPATTNCSTFAPMSSTIPVVLGYQQQFKKRNDIKHSFYDSSQHKHPILGGLLTPLLMTPGNSPFLLQSRKHITSSKNSRKSLNRLNAGPPLLLQTLW